MIVKKYLITILAIAISVTGFFSYQLQIVRFIVPNTLPLATNFVQMTATDCSNQCPVSGFSIYHKSHLHPILSKSYRSMVPPSSMVEMGAVALLALVSAYFAVYIFRWYQRLQPVYCMWRI